MNRTRSMTFFGWLMLKLLNKINIYQCVIYNILKAHCHKSSSLSRLAHLEFVYVLCSAKEMSMMERCKRQTTNVIRITTYDFKAQTISKMLRLCQKNWNELLAVLVLLGNVGCVCILDTKKNALRPHYNSHTCLENTSLNQKIYYTYFRNIVFLTNLFFTSLRVIIHYIVILFG